MNRGVIFLVLGLAGCIGTNAGQCMNMYEALCETCPKNDYNDVTCKCLAEGELSESDFSDVLKIALEIDNDEDAQNYCEEIEIRVSHVTDDDAVACAETADLMDLYGADYCDDVGWED